MGGAFSTCKWDGHTWRLTKSGLIFPKKCTVNVGGIIALMFAILAGILLLIIIGLHFRQRRAGAHDVSLTDEEELEQLLSPNSEDQSPLPLPPVPPKDKDRTKVTFLVEDSSGYSENSNEPPPPYIRE